MKNITEMLVFCALILGANSALARKCDNSPENFNTAKGKFIESAKILMQDLLVKQGIDPTYDLDDEDGDQHSIVDDIQVQSGKNIPLDEDYEYATGNPKVPGAIGDSDRAFQFELYYSDRKTGRAFFLKMPAAWDFRCWNSEGTHSKECAPYSTPGPIVIATSFEHIGFSYSCYAGAHPFHFKTILLFLVDGFDKVLSTGRLKRNNRLYSDLAL